jgi:hypothetical protein
MSPSTLRPAGSALATEMKFLVKASLAPTLAAWISARVPTDPHADTAGGYDVQSIYFDTDAFDTLQRRGSYARSKFRVRRYGDAPFVFLERKLKRSSRVGKTRSVLPCDHLSQLTAASSNSEGRWFAQRVALRALHPVCQIRYRRMAWAIDTEQGPLRLTLDSHLLATPASELQFPAQPGHSLPVDCILEIKHLGNFPALFRELTQTFALAPQPLSKYRLAAETLGLACANC